jgi:uncharacterized repeat protein (TIGR03803 family)
MRKLGFGKIACLVAAFCVATAVVSPAQTFTTVFTFSSSTGSNANSLVQGIDGNFYGTSELYGQNMGGTVYEITPSGKLISIYSFCSLPNCADGGTPFAGLLLAADGNFYGTTNGGGANGQGGTVFKLSPGGQLTTLYSFCAQAKCGDGGGPSVLVQGRDGDLYGITGAGGGGHQCFSVSGGCGTVFEITTKGVLTTLHSFCTEKSCLDGAQPLSLLLGTDGYFYGTTFEGGDGSCFDGCGTFFRMSPAGKLTPLHEFTSGEGEVPNGIVEGTDGNFYGTTRVGGQYGNGTVFQITPAGDLTTLYNFCGPSSCAGGAVPWSGVVQGSDGNFYGTTSDGGTGTNCPGLGGTPCGTIFSITPGDFAALYSFCSQSGCTDGGVPTAAMIQGTEGAFYGTTSEGGNTSCTEERGCGTVFSLSVGLGPFVQPNPVFGKVGYKIYILGNNLSGTTSVTFNGTPATFTAVSDTALRATVPTGATTGTIEVTTPSGALNSNVAFQVLQ